MKRARRGKRTETKAAAEKRWEGWDGEHDGAHMESSGKWSGEAGKGVHIAGKEGHGRGDWDARTAPEAHIAAPETHAWRPHRGAGNAHIEQPETFTSRVHDIARQRLPRLFLCSGLQVIQQEMLTVWLLGRSFLLAGITKE